MLHEAKQIEERLKHERFLSSGAVVELLCCSLIHEHDSIEHVENERSQLDASIANVSSNRMTWQRPQTAQSTNLWRAKAAGGLPFGSLKNGRGCSCRRVVYVF